jgi:hypothetical protein
MTREWRHQRGLAIVMLNHEFKHSTFLRNSPTVALIRHLALSIIDHLFSGLSSAL